MYFIRLNGFFELDMISCYITLNNLKSEAKMLYNSRYQICIIPSHGQEADQLKYDHLDRYMINADYKRW